jgi:hypothetical protein
MEERHGFLVEDRIARRGGEADGYDLAAPVDREGDGRRPAMRRGGRNAFPSPCSRWAGSGSTGSDGRRTVRPLDFVSRALQHPPVLRTPQQRRPAAFWFEYLLRTAAAVEDPVHERTDRAGSGPLLRTLTSNDCCDIWSQNWCLTYHLQNEMNWRQRCAANSSCGHCRSQTRCK